MLNKFETESVRVSLKQLQSVSRLVMGIIKELEAVCAYAESVDVKSHVHSDMVKLAESILMSNGLDY